MKRNLFTAIAVAVAFAALPAARAASSSWNVDAAGNWATAGSWAGSVIPGATSGTTSTDIATFGNTLTADRVVTVDSNRNIGGITFSNTSAFKFTLSGGNLLLSSGGVIQTAAGNGAHTDTISTAIAIQGDGGTAAFTAGATSATSLLSIGAVTGVSTGLNTTTLTLNGTNTGANTVTGIIGDGSGGGKLALVKSGAGTWTLTAANTYTGGTSINAGTLKIGSATALGGNASAVSVAATGAVLDLNGQTVANTNALTLNGSGISSGGALINSSATVASYAGTVALASDSSIGGNGAGTLTLNGTVSGAFNLTKAGTGTLIFGNVANTFGAGKTFTISAGTVKLGNAASLGDATGAVSVTNGAVLNLNGQAVANTNALTLNGSGIGGTGALMNSSNTAASYAGAVNLASDSTIGSTGTGNTFTVGGTITSTGTQNLTIKAGGTQAITLTNVNNTGTVTNSGTGGGTVTITTLGSNVTGLTEAGASPLTVTNAVGLTSSLKSFTSSGAGLFTLSGQVTGTQNLTLSANSTGNITLTAGTNSGGSITNNGAGTNTVTVGAIGATVTGGVTQNATNSILYLNGANTYTGGTTITAGTLKVGSTTALGASGSAASVATGAVLDLNGIAMTNTNALTLNGSGISNGGALINNSATAGTYAGLITLGSASSIVANTGTIAISNAGTITGAYGLTLGGAGNGTVTSIIGTGALTKQGAGTWTLSGANTYTGTTTVNGGLLLLNVAENAGTSGPLGKPATLANSIVLQGGGLQFTATNKYDYTTSGRLQLADGSTGTINTNGQNVTFANAMGVGALKTGGLTKAGLGTLTLNATNTFSGNTLVSAGTLALGNNLALQNSAIDTSGAGNINVTGYATPTFGGLIGSKDLTLVITAGYGSVTALTLNPSASKSNSYSGVIADGAAGMTLIKSGAGTQILSGNNTYTGLTTIGAGVLNIQNVTALGTTANGTSVTSGAALQIQGGITVGAEALTLNGTGIAADGALRNVSNSNVWQGTVTLGGDARINSDSGSLTFNTAANSITGSNTNLTLGGAGTGIVAGTITTGSGTLTKDGSGTWTLSGANTYTGTTTVNGGTLQIGNGTTGSLNGTSGTGLTFGGTGTANFNEAAGVAQGMGVLTISAGEGMVVSTYGTGTGNSSVTFSNVTARAAGTAMNFATSGGNGTTNKIVLTQYNGSATPTGALLDKGIFFGGSNYAAYDTGGFLRAYATGDTGYVSANGTISDNATTNVALTGAVTGQGNATVNTLNIGANNLTLANGTVFGTSGILASGGTNIVIDKTTASTIQAATAGAEMVIRVDGATDQLTINPVIQNNTSASMLTKSGAGTLTLTAANTYTGGTYLNAGTLNINNASALGTGTFTINGGMIGNTSGAAITTGNNPQTWNNDFAFTGTSNGTHDLNLGTGAVSLGTWSGTSRAVTVNAGNLTVGGIIANGTANSLTKAGTGTLALSGTNTYTGTTTVTGGLIQLNSVESVGVSGPLGNTTAANSIVLQGGGLQFTATNTYDYSGRLQLADASTGTIDTNGQNVTFANALGVGALKSGALTKAGNGTLILSGANTYTGTTTVTGGLIQLNAAEIPGVSGPLGSSTAANNILLQGGGLQFTATNTYDYSSRLLLVDGSTSTIDTNGQNVTFANAILATALKTGALTKAGAGTLTLNGVSTYTGKTLVSAGTLAIGNNSALQDSAIDTSGAGNIALSVTAPTFGGLIGSTALATVINSGYAWVTALTLSPNSGITNSYSGVIADGAAGMTLTKSGSGTQILSGANTYTGLTTVNGGGVLNIQNATALGTTANGTTVSSGAALEIQGGITVGAEALTLIGTGISSGGALRNISGTNVWQGTVTLGGAVRINSDSGSLTFNTAANSITGTNMNLTLGGAGNGTVVGTITTGTGTLTKNGTGTWILSGANTYNGTTTVNGGLIGLNVAEIAGTSGPLGNSTAANSIVLQGGGLQFTSANTYDYTTSGRLQLADASTGTINTNGQNVTFANAFGVGTLKTGALTKAGTGTLTLSRANTYKGTTTVTGGLIGLNVAEIAGVSGPLGNSTAANSIVLQGGGLQFTTNNAYDYSGRLQLADASTGTIDTNGRNVIFANALGVGALKTGALTKAGTGTLTLSAANTYTGTTTVTGGLIQLNAVETPGTSGPLGNSTAANSIVLQGGGLQFTTINTYDYSGRLLLADASTSTINTNGQSVTFANALGVGALKTGALTKAGAGSLTLSAANTYTGNTTVSAGTLMVGNATALGTGSVSVAATGAALDLNGTVMTSTNALTLNGTGVNSGGALTNSSATAGTYAGLITLGSASSIMARTGNITISNPGTITGAFGLTLGGTEIGSISSIIGTGAGTLTKLNSGAWTLAGNNTYTGSTTISAGTLKLGIAGALGNGTANTSGVTVSANGAALDLNGVTPTATVALTLNGAGVSNTGALTNSSATAGTYAGQITLGSASSMVAGSGNITISNPGTITGAFALTLGGANNGSIASIIGTGAGTLTKAGAGTWTLSGANTYTGTTTVLGGLLGLNVTEIAGVSGPLGKQLATAANSIILKGGGLQFTSNNTNDYSGRLQLADRFTGTIDTNGQSVTFATAMGVGALKSGALTKAGLGTLTLNAANTFTGKTLVSGGTLALGSNLALQSSAIDTSGAGVITLTGLTTPTFGGLIGSTDLTSVITTGYGSVTALTLNPSASISNSYSGVIANGAAGMTLTKSGAGTQILSGNNTYTGLTTVSAGVLNIQNATALGTTANGTSVTSGAALQIQGGITVGAESLALNGAGIASNGALRNISGDNVWQGAVTVTSSARINSDSGSLTFNTAPISINGTSNLALTLGGAGNGTIAGTIQTGGTGTLTKDGTGTWTLAGATNLSGLTTVSGGTLKVDAGAGGSLWGPSPYSALTFGGTGTFNYDNTTAAGAKSQNMGTLTFSLGEGTVAATRTALQTVGLTFSSLAAHVAGTTSNFVLAGTPGTNGTDDKITLTGQAAGFINQSTFFGGSNYAWMNAAGTYVRGINYNGIEGMTSGNATTLASATYQQITGAITGQNNATFTTLNISGNNDFTLAASQTVSVNGILKTGNVVGGATISGGTGIQAATSGAELVIRTDGANDALTISSPILANGASMLTKSGAGTLTLSAANNYTGGTYLNAGTLNINNAAALGTGKLTINGGTIDNTSAAALTTGNNTQAWNNDFAFTGTKDLNMGTGAVTLGTEVGTSRTITVNAGTLTEGGIISNGSTATALIKAGAGALTLGGNNTYTGGVTLNTGTLNINAAAALGTSAGTFTINGGTIGNTSGTSIAMTIVNPQTWNGDFAFTGAGLMTTALYDLYMNTGAVTLGTTEGASRTITVNSGTLAEGGVIANGATANSLIKAGAGALSLYGANIFSGGVTLNAGTLNINNAAALGDVVTSTLTINGGTLGQTANGGSGGNAGMLTADYVQVWNGDFGFSIAPVTSGLFMGVNMESLNLGNGTVSLGTVAGGAATRTITTDGYYGNLAVGGIISDGVTANSITKNGTGVLTLNGANLFTGGVTLNAGTLQIGSATALGNNDGILTINGGSLAANVATTLANNNPQVWNGSFSFRPSIPGATGFALNMGTGDVTLGGNVTVTAINSALTEGGAIGDGTNTYGVTWVAGYNGYQPTITLNGTSTYSGPTVVQSQSGYTNSQVYGTTPANVTLATGALLNTSSVTVNGNGYFLVGSTTQSNGLINSAATLTMGGNGGGYYNFVNATGSANKQTFASLTIGSGDDVLFTSTTLPSQFTFTDPNPYLRSVGGVARFIDFDSNTTFTYAPSGTGNVIGSNPATAMLVGATWSNENMILGATNFVLAPAAGGGLTALTSAPNSWGTGINTDVAACSTASGTVSQSLRLNATGSLTLPGAFTVESGGILMTSTPTAPVTITGGTITTGIPGGDLWVVEGGNGMAGSQLVDPTHGLIINSQILDNGGSSLTKVGMRALYLTNTNNTYTGGTYLADGILNVASEGSLGSGAFNFTGNAQLQAAGNVALGTRAVTIGQGLTATFDTNGNNITVGGVISSTGNTASLTKTGFGTLTLTGQNTYTGITTVNNGTLKLDFSAAGAPTSNIINPNSILNIGAGGYTDSLIIQGADGVANTQTFGATPSPIQSVGATNVLGGMTNMVFNAGAGGSLIVNLGNITGGPNNGSCLDVTTSGNVTVAGVNNTSSTLTGNLGYLDKGFLNNGGNNGVWATVNKNTWATVNTSGNLVGFANSDYRTNNTGGMADIVTSGNLTGTSVAASTLRFNDTLASGVGKTLTLSGTQVTQLSMGGGILVTANVGAQDSTITGGFLTGANLTRLAIFQNNTAANLVINSQLTDQAGASAVYKNGAGTLILNAVNVNSSAFVVNEGKVIATGDYTPSSIKTITTTTGSKVVAMSDTSGLFVGQVISAATPGLPVINGGLPNVVTAINPGVSVTISNNASASNTLNATFQSGGAIGGFSSSAITASIANGATLQIGSAATGNAGSIDPNVYISNLGTLILSHSGNYTFGNTITGAVAINSLSGTNATNTLEITGGGNTTLGASGVVNGSGAGGQGNYTLTTAGNVYAGQAVTGTNIAAGTTVNRVDGLNVYLSANILTGGATNATFSTNGTTFNGITRITGNSTLILGSALALQNSTLDYTSTGIFSFGSLTSVTLGGLSGTQDLPLTNSSSAAVALTLGGTYNSNTVTNNFNTTYSGNLTGNGSLTKNGIGTTTLTGVNTYSGNTTVSAGTLQLGSATALSGNSSAVSVASGATLDLNGQTLTNTNPLTLNGPGFIGAALANSSASAAVYAGTVTLAADNSSVGGNGAGTITLNGIVSGAFSLYKGGTDTLILNAANTFGASNKTFTIGGGTVQLGNAASLGNATSAVSVMSGAVLDLSGQTVVNTNPLTINGQYSSTIGALTNSSSAASYAGTVALGSDSSIGGNGASTLTLNGIVSGAFNLTKIGTDTLAFGNVTNTFGANKTFTISAGTVRLGNATSLGNATNSVAVTSGAVLDLYGQTVANTNPLTISGQYSSTVGAVANSSSGNASYAGTVALASDSSIGGNGAGNMTLSGVVSGAYNLTKVGSGTLVLSNAANTFGGAGKTFTISAGTVQLGVIAGSLGDVSTAVSVTSGAALDLNSQWSDVAANPVTINGRYSSTVGALTDSVGAGQYAGTVALGSASSIGGAMSFTLSGAISGNYALTKVGAGQLTLSGDNSFTGGVTISTGELRLGSTGALNGTAGSENAVAFGSGVLNAFLSINGNNVTIANLTTDPTTPGSAFVQNNANGAATATLTVGNSLNLSGTYAGIIQNRSNASSVKLALTKAGTGTLTLTGANTYSGKTIIQNGTLAFNTGNASSTGTQSLGANATVDLGVASTSSGILNYIGTASARLAKNINVLGNGADTIQNSSATGLLTLSGILTQNGTVLILKGGTGGITVNGTISGTGPGSNLIVDGGTTTLTTNSNTYAGKTVVQSGTLAFTIGNATATGAQSLGVNTDLDLGVASTSSGFLNYTGAGANTLAKNINVLGNGTDTIRNSSAAGLLTLTGTITKNGTVLTLKGGTGGITVSGTITGSNSGSDLVVDGGTTTLATANTYNGPTSIINGATLNANATGALPTATRSAVSLDQSGTGTSTLALGASQSAGSLTGAATSKVTLGANTLTLGTTGNATSTFAGVISGTNGNVFKDGTSIQVLTGNNTYTGTTTVNAGTLEAAAAGALGNTSAITVATTGTLLLSANATTNSNALTLSGGTVALIKTGTGVSNTLGALTLTETSIIDFGSISSGNNILTLGAVTWTSGKFLAIWNWSGTPLMPNGTDRLMINGDQTTWTANLGNINFYSGSGGATLIGTAIFSGNELVAVPEPATWTYTVLALGAAALLVTRRRRLTGRMKDEG